MATRLPYYVSEGDIYSRIMGQQAMPQGLLNPYAGFTGGYDPELYQRMRDEAARLNAAYIVPGLLDLGGGGMGDQGSMGATDYGLGLIGMGQSLSGYGLTGLGSAIGNVGIGQLGAAEADAAAQAATAQSMDAVAADAAAAAAAANAAADIAAMGDVGMGSGDASGGLAAADGVGASGFGDVGGFGSGDAGGGDGGGGGGGGGKVICKKLYQMGRMQDDIYEADQAFGALLIQQSPQTYAGYICWAQYVVGWMGRDDIIGKTVTEIVHCLAKPWSIAMAEEMGLKVKSNWFGRLLLKRGLQVCDFIGKMNQDRSVQNV